MAGRAGGLSLIEDYHSKTPKGEFFGLSVSWWDEKVKGYRAVWCANTLPAGCIVMAKLAKWDGNELVLGDEFERNGKKFTFKETLSDVTPNSYSQAQYEGESGSELKQLVTIHATRVASPTRANDLMQQLASQAAILKMPGPKVQNLMLGTWSTKIKYEPRKEIPQGGTGDGTQVWRPGPGGRSVIQEAHWRNALGEFDGFSVGWWDAKAEGQRFVWCANDVPEGCVVPKNVAKWEGKKLVWSEEQEEGGRKVKHSEVFSDITPASFAQILLEGEPGTESRPIVTIRATKQDAIESYQQSSTTQAPDATKIASMAATAFTQQIDPALQGFWTLNVEKSDFSGSPKPKMGQVNWGEHGWTFALVTADGRLYADGVATDRGCTLIGVFPNYSCEVEVVTPRHVRFTLKQGATIRRIGDIELLENGTAQTTHRVTPPEGAPYVEKTIWERQVRK